MEFHNNVVFSFLCSYINLKQQVSLCHQHSVLDYLIKYVFKIISIPIIIRFEFRLLLQQPRLKKLRHTLSQDDFCRCFYLIPRMTPGDHESVHENIPVTRAMRTLSCQTAKWSLGPRLPHTAAYRNNVVTAGRRQPQTGHQILGPTRETRA